MVERCGRVPRPSGASRCSTPWLAFTVRCSRLPRSRRPSRAIKHREPSNRPRQRAGGLWLWTAIRMSWLRWSSFRPNSAAHRAALGERERAIAVREAVMPALEARIGEQTGPAGGAQGRARAADRSGGGRGAGEDRPAGQGLRGDEGQERGGDLRSDGARPAAADRARHARDQGGGDRGRDGSGKGAGAHGRAGAREREPPPTP